MGGRVLSLAISEEAGPDRRILLIDDNEAIAEILAAFLSRYGYKVEWAPDGQQGLDLYKDKMNSCKYDAVLLDLVIPGGMGGKETIGPLRKIDPLAKAALISGHCDDPVMTGWQDFGFDAAFAKPFRIDELIRGLDKLIG